MERDNSFTEQSLTYRNTKLSCPSVHGLQAVVTLTEDGLAVLACGCSRGPSLPVQEQRISVENFSPFVSRAEQTVAARLFPPVVAGEITAQRQWFHL